MLAFQTSNGFLNLQAIAVKVAVGDVVSVAIIETEVRAVWFNFGQ
jgi:hypothetical protein